MNRSSRRRRFPAGGSICARIMRCGPLGRSDFAMRRVLVAHERRPVRPELNALEFRKNANDARNSHEFRYCALLGILANSATLFILGRLCLAVGLGFAGGFAV